MKASSSDESVPIPVTSLVFGYGPMLPLVAAAIGTWTLAAPWPGIALRLALIWGAAILIFVAGVRRGYGFGSAGASTTAEIVTMLLYCPMVSWPFSIGARRELATHRRISLDFASRR